ncbi:MAG: Pycsar system effector family protein [Bacteroidota bacterium]
MNTAERESLIEQASDSVFTLLRDSLPEQLVYHNFLHTIEVVKGVEAIGRGSGLDDEDLEILSLAAWFHDAGYTEVYKGHEERGAEMAERFLRERRYPEENITLVIGCILATRVPQRPRNILEEIICDADLAHLGRKTFAERNELLRLEWELALGKHFTELGWANLTIDFLRGNPYHTRFAQVEWSPQRAENLVAVQSHLRRLLARDEEAGRRNAANVLELQHASPTIAADGGELGIISRIHFNLVSTADANANVMIIVNTLLILIALIVNFAVRNNLLYPTLVLMLVCAATIIAAIFVVRPARGLPLLLQRHIDSLASSEGVLLENDEMISDDDDQQEGRIADLQTFSNVVRSKYSALRLVYGTFLFGLLFAVLFYLIYPELFSHSY